MSALERPLRILFLCTGNSCRSQMAEGWANHLKAGALEAYSAGTHTQAVNPLAVAVMKEAGIDISHKASKHFDSLKDINFDCVITVCSSANETCPVFPNARKKLHVPFDDPPYLARNAKNQNEALAHYRRVRDEIRDFVATLPEAL